MRSIVIQGGGPAGASAALAALRFGAPATVVEKAQFPRHKVCGEFLSPEIFPVFERLGIANSFVALKPAVIRRMSISIGSARKSATLPEPAFGLSRWSLDNLLWNEAMAAGAVHARNADRFDVVATGRAAKQKRGNRLFGFKAHFLGPSDDAVELFFAGTTYVGVNCVEGGITNVCGLALEEHLNGVGFDVDRLVQGVPGLQARLAPLRRQWEWIFTGPLQFGPQLAVAEDVYRAGDALSFVDPFTGSGLLCAVATGSLAGQAAARSLPIPAYRANCSRLLQKPFEFSSLLRRLAQTRVAATLLRLAPPSLLFRQTRPLV